MRRHRSLFLGLVALVFIGIAWLGRDSGDGRALYRDAQRAGLLCQPPVDDLDAQLEVLLRGTRFGNRWSVNTPPTADRLNIAYFCPTRAGSAVPARLSRLVRNCAYAGPPNLIVCDRDFFSGFVTTSGLAGELHAEAIPAAARALHFWVIGHEIGHVVSNHRAAHFMAARIEDIVASSSLDQRTETAADEWFVRQIVAFDLVRRRQVDSLLMSLIYAQVRAKVGSDRLYPGTGLPITNQWIEYARKGSHPEFVIRATRMLSLSFGTEPGGWSGGKIQLDGFARGLREAR